VGSSAPLVTVTTAMSPAEMLNPSDDYIWQILFAGENDVVPKRVTGAQPRPAGRQGPSAREARGPYASSPGVMCPLRPVWLPIRCPKTLRRRRPSVRVGPSPAQASSRTRLFSCPQRTCTTRPPPL
jgi:hypothetical protein